MDIWNTQNSVPDIFEALLLPLLLQPCQWASQDSLLLLGAFLWLFFLIYALSFESNIGISFMYSFSNEICLSMSLKSKVCLFKST